MKKFAKKIVVAVLGWQLRRLQKKRHFVTIAVVGSIGKTSTKFAIANVLKQNKVVRYQAGNYNDIVSVPLIFFGQTMPSLLNPFAWLNVFRKNEKVLRKPYHYDVVVAELGTDGPGQIKEFAQYLKVDLAVVTAIAPEHMEYFKDLDSVANEEFSIAEFSDKLLVNADLCEQKYYKKFAAKTTTYGKKAGSDFEISAPKFTRIGTNFVVKTPNGTLKLSMDALGTSEIYSAAAAVAVAQTQEFSERLIKSGVAELRPVSGRMVRFTGIKDSLILDDTYNASPVAVIAALDVLYTMKAPQKIALLGNMNELGEHSKAAHEEVGKYCNPDQLDLVVTLGPDANQYLAPMAQKQGCNVKSFDTPYAAGEYIKEHMQKKALILAKGSQNKVFAEEAVKLLLADPKDNNQLVRQSKYWMKAKKKSFKHV